MSGVSLIEVKESDEGMRLDRWFKQYYPHISHGMLQKMLRKGEVRLDSKKTTANTRVESGQQVRIPPITNSSQPKKPRSQISEKDTAYIQSLVLYKSKDEIVINKPAGLAVQGGSKTTKHIDGLLEGLKYELEDKPKLVHRLDRDTSGVLILARHRKAASRLTKAFKEHTIKKIYWALVNGVPRPHEGRIDMPLVKAGKLGQQRMRCAQASDKDKMSAVSDFSLVSNAANRFSWLALNPRTGRTHQLRVHMKEIGHAIFGDYKYKNDVELDEQANLTALGEGLHLHAAQITFPRAGGLEETVSAPLPSHMEKSWALLGFDTKLEHDPFEGVDQ